MQILNLILKLLLKKDHHLQLLLLFLLLRWLLELVMLFLHIKLFHLEKMNDNLLLLRHLLRLHLHLHHLLLLNNLLTDLYMATFRSSRH
jgi:hypothetical protein